MRYLLLLPLFVLATLAQDTPKPKEPAVDVTYLRDHAQTRGFQLGRPTRPKILIGAIALVMRLARILIVDHFAVAVGSCRIQVFGSPVVKCERFGDQ